MREPTREAATRAIAEPPPPRPRPHLPHVPGRPPDLPERRRSSSTTPAYADIQGTGGLRETWYSRFNNPTVDAAGAEVARLHGAARSLMTASGMAAIATTLLTLLRSGDTVVASKQVYGDTDDLLATDLPALGITVVRVDAFDTEAWRSAVADHHPAVLYGETLSNPQLRLLDIPAVAGIAHGPAPGSSSTTRSPRPTARGRSGLAPMWSWNRRRSSWPATPTSSPAPSPSTTRPCHEEIQRRLITFGGCLDPHAAFLVWRGMRTFGIRLAEAARAAASIADTMAAEPGVEHVRYPGRSDHPDAGAVADAVMPGPKGAMVSLILEGGDERSVQVLRHLGWRWRPPASAA